MAKTSLIRKNPAKLSRQITKNLSSKKLLDAPYNLISSLICSASNGSFCLDGARDDKRFAPSNAAFTKGSSVGEAKPAVVCPHLIPFQAALSAPWEDLVWQMSLAYNATMKGSAGQGWISYLFDQDNQSLQAALYFPKVDGAKED